MRPVHAQAFDPPTATRRGAHPPSLWPNAEPRAGDRRRDRRRQSRLPHGRMRNGEAALDHLASALPVTAKSVAGPFARTEVLATD